MVSNLLFLATDFHPFYNRTFPVALSEKKKVTVTVNILMDSPVPVSYTHLDVYKRQVCGSLDRK